MSLTCHCTLWYTGHMAQLPKPIRYWSGIAWHGAWFDNEEDARRWGLSEATRTDGSVGRWEVHEAYPGDKDGQTGESMEGKWFARVHV
jgi:hypothetical protein